MCSVGCKITQQKHFPSYILGSNITPFQSECGNCAYPTEIVLFRPFKCMNHIHIWGFCLSTAFHFINSSVILLARRLFSTLKRVRSQCSSVNPLEVCALPESFTHSLPGWHRPRTEGVKNGINHRSAGAVPYSAKGKDAIRRCSCRSPAAGEDFTVTIT